MAIDIVSFLFYVDPETELVDGVYAFSPFGMTMRQDSKWVGVNRRDSGIDDKIFHRFYTLDWDKVPVIEEEVDFYDPEALQLFDKGGLTEEVLKNYATLQYNGKPSDEETELA
jgi:hypothetical protein